MNGGLVANAVLVADIRAGLAGAGGQVDVVVCVPAPYLAQAQEAIAGSPLMLGAQDVSAHAGGAHTGEVSAGMLAEFACRHVIVGHSERRACHGETDMVVAAKAAAALQSGLTPIVCVGETLEEREAGLTDAVVGRQIDAILDDVVDWAGIVVAYEPVWAIGTGRTATPEMAQDVHAKLRGRLAARDGAAAAAVRILYGGSMKPGNAKELLTMSDIDGGLIGGASLNAADFLAIVQAAQGDVVSH